MTRERQVAVASFEHHAAGIPRTSAAMSPAPLGGGEEERSALTTLAAMFGPRWSEAELRGVLRSCGGDAGRAVEALLTHEASGRQGEQQQPQPRAAFAAGGATAAAVSTPDLAQSWRSTALAVGAGAGEAAAALGGVPSGGACRGSLLDDDDEDTRTEGLRHLRMSAPAPLPSTALSRSRTATKSARIMEECESRVREFRGLMREHGVAAAAGGHGHGHDVVMTGDRSGSSGPTGSVCGSATASPANGDGFQPNGDTKSGGLKGDFKLKDYKGGKDGAYEDCKMGKVEYEDYSYEMDDYEGDEEDDGYDYDFYEERERNKAALGAMLTMPTKDVQRSHSCNGFSVCSSLSSATRYDAASSSGSGSGSGSGSSGSGCGSSNPLSSPQHSAALLSLTSGSGPSGHNKDRRRRSHSAPSGCCGSGGCGSGNSDSLYPELPGLAAGPGPGPSDSAGAGKVSFHSSRAADAEPDNGAEKTPISAMSTEQKDRLLHSLLFDPSGGHGHGHSNLAMTAEDLDLAGRKAPAAHRGTTPSPAVAVPPAKFEDSMAAPPAAKNHDPLATPPFDAAALDEILGRPANAATPGSSVAGHSMPAHQHQHNHHRRQRPGVLDRRSLSAPLDELDKKDHLIKAGAPGAVHFKSGGGGGGCDDPLLDKALRLSMADSERSGKNEDSDPDLARALELSKKAALGRADDRLLRGDDDLARALKISQESTQQDMLRGDDDLERALELSRRASSAAASSANGNEEAGGHDSAQDLERALRLSRQTSQMEAQGVDKELAMALELSRKESHGIAAGGMMDYADSTAHDDFLNQVLPSSFAGASFPGSPPVEGPLGIPRPSGLVKQRQSSTGSNSLQSMDECIDQPVVIRGAGEDAVNGRYVACGRCNGTSMYTKAGTWDGRPVAFSLFRCSLLAGGVDERRWFISIVPPDVKPGTDEDRDFYVAPGSGERGERPPADGWVALAPFGRGPSPACEQEPAPPAPMTAKRRMSSISVPGAFAGGVAQQAFVIESAGCKVVVGTYERTGSHNGAGLFTKATDLGGAPTSLSVFRATAGGDGRTSHRWFLSLVPEGCSPGSMGDTDLYIADGLATGGAADETPPQHGWRAVPGFGVNPPPLCKLESIREEEHQTAPPYHLRQESSACASLQSALTTSTPLLPVVDYQGSSKPRAPTSTRTRKVAMCIVCKSRPVTHVLIPCGHPCLCEGCASDEGLASMRGRCPVARCEFGSVMRFFGTVVED